MGVRFSPTEDFKAEINGNLNQYRAGKVYTVHDTPAHKELERKVQHWAANGWVKLVGATKGASRPHTVKTGG